MAIDQFLLLATLAFFFLSTQASLKGPLRFYDTKRLFLARLWATFELVVMISNQTIP